MELLLAFVICSSGGKEEEEEKHDDESLKNAEGMDEQEAEKKQDEVEEEDKEVVEKEEDMEAVEKEEDMEAVEKEEDEKAVEKEEDEEAVEKEEDEEAVGREEEETGVGEAQAESAEKQEETEDKQERTVVTEDPPHECEKEGTEVEGKQGDNGAAGGEVPGGCDQEMDTSTAPTSAESAVSQSSAQTLSSVEYRMLFNFRGVKLLQMADFSNFCGCRGGL